MQKPGSPLKGSITDLGGEVLTRLRDEFSITTVEELVSASTRGGDNLRLHLGLTPVKWASICDAARKFLSPETVSHLERPIPSRLPKGATFGSGLARGCALGKHLASE